MAESVLLLVTEKIGIALAKDAAEQACFQFSKYAKKLKELQENMDRFRRQLHVLQDVLYEMDIRNRKQKLYEGWLDEVWKVAHAMEDTVDDYLYRVGQEHNLGYCFYLKKGFREPRSLLSFSRIASNVKKLEKDLRHLSDMKHDWLPVIVGEDTNSSDYIIKRSQDLATSSYSLDEEDLVGVDGNRAKLEQWLGGDDMKCSLATLLGMGGIGKTALAANVYKKERAKFQCHAWVSISQTYSREDVLRKVIKEVYKDKVSVPSDIATMDFTTLEETLKMYLEHKKYLIILDDVWTRKAFDDLSRALLCNGTGSRILITTREGDVSRLASKEHILTLEILPDEQARVLFYKKSFPQEKDNKCPEELRPLSEEIVGKCKGLPLAIVSIGSLLHVQDKTMEDWRRINGQLGWEINNNQSLDHIKNVLQISFIYLPTYLKSCFLYCSLFFEDYIFQRKKLVWLWIAEGFIVKKGENSLEEVAEGYLKELVNRNLLQLVEKNSFGRIKRFKMHDIMRELGAHLCQQNHFGVKYEEYKCGGSIQSDERRLIVHKLDKDINLSYGGVHRLRTFITLDKNMPSVNLLPQLSDKARYMTVLELSGLPVERIPDAIGDLFNLRHLGLRDTKVKLLPKSIEKLSNLLTLDLANSDIQEVPAGIVKLKNLRHLFAENLKGADYRDFHSASGVCIPKDLVNLTNLQTLQSLEAQDESVRQLGQLRQLRSLRILNVKGTYCERLCESLVQMAYLSNLDVGASDENEVLMLNALPHSLQKLSLRGRLAEGALLGEAPLLQAVAHNLHALHLSLSQLREDPLPSLSQLSNLTVVTFTRAYNGEKLVFLTGWFPKLKFLYLLDLPNLRELEIKQGAMASLEALGLGNLSSMMEVPLGIEFLLPLQYLGFLQITRDFLELLRQHPRSADMERAHISLRD